MRYFSIIVNSVNNNLLHKNGVSISNKETKAATRVKSSMNHTNNYYYSGSLRISSNLDYYIWREADNDPKHDHFALETSYEITPYNGTLYRYTMRHDQYSSNHQIDQWSPASSGSTSSWTVSLPWGISWNFSSLVSISNSTTGSQTSDFARWYVSRSGNWISSTSRFRPGSTWVVQNPSGYFATNSKLELETYISGPGIVKYNQNLLCTYYY